MPETKNLRLYMKSGNIIDLPLSDWQVKGDATDVAYFKWNTSTDQAENPMGTKLIHVVLPQIEAIVQTELD